MRDYEFILAGGGMAGLSLAYHLLFSPLQDRNILIIDLEDKQNNDRTWCFWDTTPSPYHSIVHKRWSHFLIESDEYSERIPLAPYDYRMIRGEDFYRFVKDALGSAPNVTFLQARVNEMRELDDRVEVHTSAGTYTGRWVFDSLFFPREFHVDEQKYHFLKQHFVGWFIRTSRPLFDPEAATWFDFRVPQKGEMRFMYLLPTSEREALVEFTLFSYTLLEREEYEENIRRYIAEVLQLGQEEYEILEREDGIIPMTDQPFQRSGGRRIMRIGTKGGMVKASTGFTFHRTQRDCRHIVASLVGRDTPFHSLRPSPIYPMMDSMLLQIMHRKGELSKPIFIKLFENNPIQRLLRFLDEEAETRELLQIMNSVPWWPFIAAGIKLKVLRKV
ncbi:MAG: lycopene cyclase family protein [Alkalispirochaetaceae bacterium]